LIKSNVLKTAKIMSYENLKKIKVKRTAKKTAKETQKTKKKTKKAAKEAEKTIAGKNIYD
jgi:hypothetical protein